MKKRLLNTHKRRMMTTTKLFMKTLKKKKTARWTSSKASREVTMKSLPKSYRHQACWIWRDSVKDLNTFLVLTLTKEKLIGFLSKDAEEENGIIHRTLNTLSMLVTQMGTQ